MTKRRPLRSPSLTKKQLWAAMVVAGIAHLFVMLRHEPWRDEFQAWAIAVHAHSPLGVLRNARYEGHPIVWHLLLWLVSRISTSVVAFELVTLAFALATTYVVLRWAPFPFIAKLALVFGYYLFYEYGTIGRSYGPGVFFLTVLCVLAARKPLRPYAFGVASALAYSTSFHTAFVAGCLTIAVVLDSSTAIRLRVIAATIATGGLILWALQVLVYESAPSVTVRVSIRADHVLVTIAHALVTIPNVGIHFWESNALDRQPEVFLSIVGLFGLAAVAYRLRSDKRIVALWVLGAIVLSVFGDYYQLLFARHTGHIALLGVFLVWLVSVRDNASVTAGIAKCAVVALLVTQLFASGVAAINDSRHPFSDAKATAHWIKTVGDPAGTACLVVAPPYLAAGIDSYVHRPLISISTGRPITFVRWTKADDLDVPADEIASTATAATAGGCPRSLLLTNRTLPVDPPRWKLVRFPGRVIDQSDEYFVYAST